MHSSKYKKVVPIILVAFLFLQNLNGTLSLAAASDSGEMRDMTAAEIVGDMRAGWNLGNTLDAHGDYKDQSSYQMVAYYMDGTNYSWNMTDPMIFSWTGSSSLLTATLDWDMVDLKSADSSKTNSLGFQIWNFSGNVAPGEVLKVDVKKAEFVGGDKTYPFPKLLGSHEVTMDGKVGSFGITSFDNDLTKTSQLKKGTFSLTVEITSESKISKEAYFETLWGNPLTTKAMIDDIKGAGFNAVRIPVTWYCHMDRNGKIDGAWMDRVEEVVNYILDNGMYCILNVHHDTAGVNEHGAGWLKAATSDPSALDRFSLLWTQIAERFQLYGDHLLYEGFNEILIQDSKGADIWGNPGEKALLAVNELNQLFVDTVRATGGNNAIRHLVVNTYAASSDQSIIDGFELPEDTIENHLIAEVHIYAPHDFGWYDITWATPRDTWGTMSDKTNLNTIFDSLDQRFTSQGIPVIIGEFGTCNKNNTPERVEHAGYYVSSALERGIVCFWWDNGGVFEVSGEDGIYKEFGLYNRRELKWEYSEIAEALVDAADGSKIQIFRLTISKVPNHAYSGKEIKPSVTVTDGTEKLSAGTDYTLSYSDNITTGKATISIAGTGEYAGTANIDFYIVPKQVAIKSITGTKPSPCIINWNGITGADGYQVSYSTSKTGTYKNAGFTKNLSMKLSWCKKGVTYYFKVRAYVMIESKNVYGQFSPFKSCKIK